MHGFRLGIDYGSSNTVAMLRWPDGRIRPLLFDGSPLLPSAVYATPEGRLLVGRDAERSARMDPGRLALNPKRYIDEGTVLLGDLSIPLGEVIAATMRRVGEEAFRAAGQSLVEAVVTYPAAWGALRRGVLVEALARAGLPAATLVAEPVAAAAYFTTVLGHRVAPGQVVVVYDLGAGTLDVSAVRRTPDGLEVLAVDGLPDFGGLDLDAIVVDQVGTGVDPDTWQRLTAPQTPEDQRHFRTLWDDARAVKEMLCRQPSAGLHLPLAEHDVIVTREEFESAARSALTHAAELTSHVMAEAGVDAARLAGLFLVGGSSRVPLVGTLLHQVTGIAPTVLEQPEIVVAEGSLYAAARQTSPPPTFALSIPAGQMVPQPVAPHPVTPPDPVLPSSGSPAPPMAAEGLRPSVPDPTVPHTHPPTPARPLRRWIPVTVVVAVVAALAITVAAALSDPLGQTAAAVHTVRDLTEPKAAGAGGPGDKVDGAAGDSEEPRPTASDSPAKPSAGPSALRAGDLAAPTSAAARNLLADPGFETSPPGWAEFGPSTRLTVVTTSRTGGHALQVATTATGTVSAGATSNPVQVRTEQGRTYTASCWARSASPIGVHVQVQEYTPSWQRVTDPAPSEKVILADPGRWYPVSVSYKAATSGNLLPLVVFSNGLAPGGHVLLVDDCALT